MFDLGASIRSGPLFVLGSRVRCLIARSVCGLGLGFLVFGCSSEQLMCPQWILSPIVVEVRDAATGAPAAVGATGSIRSGSFVSELTLPWPNEDLELYSSGGPGIYDVIVQKPGYRDWIRNDVRVTGGRCGVEKSVVLRANLERTS